MLELIFTAIAFGALGMWIGRRLNSKAELPVNPIEPIFTRLEPFMLIPGATYDNGLITFMLNNIEYSVANDAEKGFRAWWLMHQPVKDKWRWVPVAPEAFLDMLWREAPAAQKWYADLWEKAQKPAQSGKNTQSNTGANGNQPQNTSKGAQGQGVTFSNAECNDFLQNGTTFTRDERKGVILPKRYKFVVDPKTQLAMIERA